MTTAYSNIVDATVPFVDGTFDAQDVRLATLGNALPGLFAAGDLAVTQRAAGANQSVDIAAGRVFVDPGGSLQGVYLAYLEASQNTSSDLGLTWPASDGSNPRIDLLLAQIGDTSYGDSYTGLKFRVETGTPNASATNANLRQHWPTIPAGCFPIAAVKRSAGATTIVTADIYNIDTVGGPAVYSRNGIQAFADAGTIRIDGGRIVTFSGAASQTITLPIAEPSAEFEILNIDSSDNVTIACGGADTFTDGATTSLVIPPNGKVSVQCLESGIWRQEWPSEQQLASGFDIDTSGASGFAGGGNHLSITVAGDGSTPVLIEAYLQVLKQSTADDASAAIRDNTTQVQLDRSSLPAGYRDTLQPKIVVPAFTGSKTFNLFVSCGSGTVDASAAVTAPNFIRATWAPGHTVA